MRPSPVLRLFAELRHRHVFRVAAAYGIVAWLLIQIAATTFPLLGIPTWGATLVVVLSLAGFPVALILAWAFELTPNGVERAPRYTTTPAASVLRPAAVALLALLAGGVYVGYSYRAAAATELRSIAVLPFDNLSSDPENEHFSEGFTEDVLGNLAKISDLRVIGRTSVMVYKDTDKSAREIAAELGVAMILDGAVRRSGNRVKITAQLINARTGDHLWSQSYDRELTEVWAIQSEIAQEIARELRAKLTPGERRRIWRAPTTHPEAYDLYLQARRHTGIGLVDREKQDFAVDLLKRAVELDPSFADAYAELGAAYASRGGAWVDSGLVAARRAVSLAPESAAPYHVLGHIHRRMLGRLDEAEWYFHRSLALEPNQPQTLLDLGWLSRDRGKYDDALAYHQRALELGLAPEQSADAAYYHFLSSTYAWLRMHDQAERAARAGLTRYPYRTVIHRDLLWAALERQDRAHAGQLFDSFIRTTENPAALALEWAIFTYDDGDLETARRALDSYHALATDSSRAVRAAVLEALIGRSDGSADAAQRALLKLGRRDAFFHSSVAMLAAAHGETERAIEHLQLAVDHGYRQLRPLQRSLAFQPLRADPRFQRLVQFVEADIARMRRNVERAGH